MSVYEPREDTALLLTAIEKYAQGRVLDMGTGSGELAIAAAKHAKVATVVAVDIDDEATEYCKERLAEEPKALQEKIEVRSSDLFSDVEEKFDTVLFNPPYLPNDKRVKDPALDGGKLGYEVIERFLTDAGKHLEDTGVILLLFSSLTNKDRVLALIREHGFRYEEELEAAYFFERLYVFALWKIL